MLIALGADPTIKNGLEDTAEQYAMAKLSTSFRRDPENFKDYDFITEKFEICPECVKKKVKFEKENKIKARLVVKGFQKIVEPKSDAPTATR